jgi:KDO2-lipid IV(A) lauroyltransferase
MTALRSRFGVRMVAAKRLLRELTRLRRQAHIAAFVADQVPTTSPNRQWLTFLGRATAFFPGPAEIARIGSYEVYYAAVTRLARGHYQMRFLPVAAAGEGLEPPEFTRRYAACVEQQIRAAPENWMWVHRRWKLEPPAAD